MKFHCEDNYYFPDLVGIKSGKIDQYSFCENEWMLRLILDQLGDSMVELFLQYPMALEEDFMNKLINHAYHGSCKLKVNPECCYHYSSKDHGVSKGVILLPIVEDLDLFMGRMITNYGKRRQTKVDFVYDLDNGCLLPKRVLDVEINENVAIQQNFPPKMLSRVRKYLNY